VIVQIFVNFDIIFHGRNPSAVSQSCNTLMMLAAAPIKN